MSTSYRLGKLGSILLCAILLQFAVLSGWTGKAAAATVSKLVLSTNSVTLAVGSSQTLTATAVYDSGATDDVTINTDWSSGDSTIATVYNGTIVAKAEGTVVITATYSGKTVVVQVEVTKKVRSLSKNKTKVDLRIGGTDQIHLTATYSDNSTAIVDSDAEWSIDDDSVATVQNGTVTGVSSGTATITAKYGTLSVSIPVYVDVVRRLTPDKTTVSLKEGDSSQIVLTAMFNDGTQEDVSSLAEWTSSNSQVADAYKGKITAYGSGTATITASYGTMTAAITVDVELAKVLTVSDSSIFLKEGGSTDVTITATYADGTSEDVTSKAEWASADDSVAYVVNGKLYGYSVGQTTIVASYGTRTVTIDVDVSVPRQLTAGSTSYSLRKGATQAVAVTATYLDGTTEDVASKADWTSDNEDVAYVSKGKIYAVSQGTAVLTASYGGKSVSITVYVDTTRKLAASSTSLSMKTGETKQITLTITYTDGTTSDVTTDATWSTDQTDIISLYQGAVTAKSTGQATVTAKYGGETVTVTVGVSLVKKLALDQTDLFLTKTGSKTTTLTATYDDGSTEDVTSKATWTSSDDSIAYVSLGKITAAGTGQATITASYGGKTATVVVDVAVARKLTLDTTTVSVRKGATKQVKLTATYADGSTEDVTASATWSSSDEAVAYAKSGLIYTYASGEAVITAQYGSKTATVTVDVDQAKTITASSTKLILQEDGSSQITLTVAYSDGETADVTSLATWGTKDSSVATVKNGLVSAVSRGATSVTGSYGGKTVTITVSVGEITQLTVSTSTVSLKDSGFQQVQATATFKDGTTKDVTDSADWTTSNSGVALVSDGLITAVESGKATVTATYGGQSATVTVEVEQAKSLSVNKRTIVMSKDDVYQLALTMTDSAGATEDVTKKATWTSSAASVADVTDGLVTAYAQGKATITGKYGGKSLTVSIEVDAPTKLTISKKTLQLKAGGTEALTVTATFSDGTTRDVTSEADWTSSNIKAADVSAGTVTAADTGKATIYAKFGGKSASVSVEVNKLKYLQSNTHRITMKVGETANVTLTATYSDGSEANVNSQAVWSSSKVSIADVKDGVITAEYKGTTTVRAKFAGKTVSITVIVE